MKFPPPSVVWSCALITASFAVTSCAGDSAAAAPAQSHPITVETYTLPAARIEPTERVYTGIVHARREVAVGTQVGGAVMDVPVQVGSRVGAGDILVQIDDRRPKASQAALSARIEASEAELARLKAGPRTETIDAAKAQVRALEEELRLAQLQLTRREELLTTDSASQEEVDVGRAQTRTLDARLRGAQSQLAELENGTRKEDLLAAEANLRALRADHSTLQIDIDDATIRAPFAGRIQSVMVRRGAVLPAGSAVVRLVEDGVLEAHFGLPVSENAPSTPAAITLMLGQRALAFENARPLPQMDPGLRTVTWVFDLLETNAIDLTPGQSLRMVVRHDLEQPGWRIPLTAITEGVRGMWTGYALLPAEGSPDQLRLQAVDLEVIHTGRHTCVVTGALQAGDLLLANGLDRVVPGQWVEAKPVAASAAQAEER